MSAAEPAAGHGISPGASPGGAALERLAGVLGDRPPEGARCVACERLLKDGEPCWSGLFPSEEEAGIARHDYCLACSEQAPEPLTAWKTVYRKPSKLPRVSIDPALAVDLLDKLVAKDKTASADETADRERLTFLVVLLLLRRKVLRLVKSEGGKLRVRRPGIRRSWTIREVPIEPAQLPAMDRELTTLRALDSAAEVAETA